MEKGQKLVAAEFISYCWEVVAWNAVSRGGEHVFSPEEEIKQLDYCLEEIQETLEAYEEGNLVEVLDGLADCLVTLSYLIALGRKGDVQCFEFIKGGFVPDSSNNFYLRLAGSYQRLSTDFPMLIDAEVALLDVIGALNSINDQWNESVDVVGVIEEVLDSNWSKFPHLDQVIPMEECKWIEEHRGKVGVTYSVIGNKVVFRDKGGKIMKPGTFEEPDIQKYIYEEDSNMATNLSQGVKVGTVVQAKSRETGLTEEELYIVESLDLEGSLPEGEVVYNIRRLNSQSIFGMLESWTDNGWMLVLQGDEDDCDKVEVSDQVAEVRGLIELSKFDVF